MNIMVDIGHPKHVHVFKNMIFNLRDKGHKVKITAKNKEITFRLLDAYNLEYESVGRYKISMVNKAIDIPKINIKLLKIAKTFKPDIFISKGSPYAAQVSRLVRKPHIAFKDTEHANLTDWLTLPFTDTICTPSCFKKKIDSKKHVKFNGYFELAYLHPNYFKPDPAVLDDLGLSKNDRYIILRFVSWQASHDIGEHGLELTDLRSYIRELENYGKVFITSESSKRGFEDYKLTVPPEKIHHVLYYAAMYIGEGAAMASESAILGTPAIYVNTQRLGYLEEQERRYGLVYNFNNPERGAAQKEALSKAVELLEDGNLKSRWQRKREKLLKDKIDVTKFMTEFIENYPESFEAWRAKNKNN